jgi:lipopolysaccharide/colanic/teichoic acid biosynthesis glycosyltransferase
MSSADLITLWAWARPAASDRASTDRTSTDRTSTDRTSTDRTTADRTSADRPGNERAAGNCAAFRLADGALAPPDVARRAMVAYERRVAAGRLAALVLLVFVAPLLALLMAAVRLTSKGPALYQQRRVGRGGRIFTMWKLRTMRSDAEVATGPVWAALGHDLRVTPLGYWLRRLHLDELPQLVNVLRGEMALVGPRPERPEFVTILAAQIPGYLDRLEVLPGITGLAQINLPPDTDLTSVRRKLVLDQQYIQDGSAPLDLRIVLSTALRLFGLQGGRSVRLLGLQRTVELPPAPPAASERTTSIEAPEMAALER